MDFPMPRFLPLLGLVILAVVLFTGCEESANPQIPQPSVTVVTLTEQPVTLNRELTGRLSASLIAEVRPRVTGIVRERSFVEGGIVEADQVLYQLDDATYQADVVSAQAELDRAMAVLSTAKLNATRAAELVKSNMISTQEYDTIVSELQQAEAEVGIAKASLNRAQVILGYARIRSPINGIIGKSEVTQGALVTENQDTALTTVQQIDPIFVDLRQSSSEYLQFRKQFSKTARDTTDALPVSLILEDGSTYPTPGRLAFSDISVDPNTGSYGLRITVDNPNHLLLPGMYVRAVLAVGQKPNGILVPQPGVLRDPRGLTSAMIVNDQGQVEIRPISVSQTVADQWLVDSGLQAGDRVIVEGFQKIQPGMTVHFTEHQVAARESEVELQTMEQAVE
jgi:membrane fusion protein, multidrug efflux system